MQMAVFGEVTPFSLAIPMLDTGIVRFMSKCKRIFGDMIFTSCPIKLNFSSIISTF